MTKSIEVSGRTEDEAIAAALAQLGLGRDEVSVEIIERAKSGFLGIGGSPAVVRVSYEYEESAVEKTRSFLEGLFQKMEVEVAADIAENDEGVIKIKLQGEEMGSLIGRRGETLDAIQHLTNYAVNHAADKRVKINIDAENYRERRADALGQLAEKVAAKVVKYRRNVTLEPMNAYERHVIHTALQEFSGVTTYSVGTEPGRRIVVAYEKGAAPEREARSPRRDSRRDEGGRRHEPRQSADAGAAEESKPETKYTSREWS